MRSSIPVVAEVLERCKDELIDVGVMLGKTTPDHLDATVPAMDLKLRSAYQVADACRRLETLLRPPRPGQYDPAALLRGLSGQLPVHAPDPGIEVERMDLYVGDAAQVLECVRLVLRNFQVEAQGRLQVLATARDGRGRIVFSLGSSGEAPGVFDLDGVYLFDLEELRGRWHAATHGGVVEVSPGTLTLYLEGDAEVPLPTQPYDVRREAALVSLTRRLRPWRGAIGDYEPGHAAPEEVIELYRKTVAAALEDAGRAVGLTGAAQAST